MYFEGDNAITEFLNVGELPEMDINVRILMTQQRNERLMESNAQASMILEKFWAFPEEKQQRIAPLVKEQLQALQITTADQVSVPGAQFLPGTPEAPAQGEMPLEGEAEPTLP